MSFLVEVVPLVLFFVALSAWAFKYLFNHDIIRNYLHSLRYPKAQINSVIDRGVSAVCRVRLLHLDVDDEADDETKLGLAPELHPIASGTQGFNWLEVVVGGIFSIVITLSCELVFLLMLQLFASVDVNLWVFRTVITTLVVLVTIVQPLVVIVLYVSHDALLVLDLRALFSVLRVVAMAALWFAWLVLLWFSGSIARVLGPDEQNTFIEEKTNEIVLAGISMTAILSGIGCVSTPIQVFWTASSAKKSAQTLEASMNELIQSYNSTKMLMRKRQQELNSLLATTGGTVYNIEEQAELALFKGKGRRILNRVQSFTTLPGLGVSSSEEDELTSEIAALGELKELIYVDICKGVRKALAGEKPARLFLLARAFKVVNTLFSIYCIYRVVNVLVLRLPYHYFWSNNPQGAAIQDGESPALNKNTKDALAITIAKIIQSVGYLPLSETQLINQVSFILSGSLFVCSLQNVLITFKSIGHFLPSSAAVSASVKSWLKNLLVSECVAIYVVATALLIRSNLPTEAAEQMLRILSLTYTGTPKSSDQMLREVEFIDTWFDKVFGLSCLASMVVIAMKRFIENDGIREEYDEEMFIEDQPGLKQL